MLCTDIELCIVVFMFCYDTTHYLIDYNGCAGASHACNERVQYSRVKCCSEMYMHTCMHADKLYNL